ncbi:MAG: ester cyclase, partial [Caldilineaceae bacterium]|nr:ester cyclase [Caldilineaceae bacterium]
MDLFIRQLVDAWNSRDIDQIIVLYDADYLGYDVALARPQQGIADLHASLNAYWQAFPDLHFTAEHFVFDGEQLALFWRATGTHRGTFLHIPATGHAVEVRGA